MSRLYMAALFIRRIAFEAAEVEGLRHAMIATEFPNGCHEIRAPDVASLASLVSQRREIALNSHGGACFGDLVGHFRRNAYGDIRARWREPRRQPRGTRRAGSCPPATRYPEPIATTEVVPCFRMGPPESPPSITQSCPMALAPGGVIPC